MTWGILRQISVFQMCWLVIINLTQTQVIGEEGNAVEEYLLHMGL